MAAAVARKRDSSPQPTKHFYAAENSDFNIQNTNIYALTNGASGGLRFLGEIHYAEVYRAVAAGGSNDAASMGPRYSGYETVAVELVPGPTLDAAICMLYTIGQ